METVEVILDSPLQEYAAARRAEQFTGYSSEQQAEIIRALWPDLEPPPEAVVDLFFELEDEAAHYREVRSEFDAHTKDNLRARRQHLEKLLAAIDLLSDQERALPAPDEDFIASLAHRRDRVEIALLQVDPFESGDSYLTQTAMMGFGTAETNRPRFPEHSFVASCCRIFAKWRGIGVEEIEIGNDSLKNPFLRFANSCTAPFDRGAFSDNAVRDAARKFQRGQLDFTSLHARRF